MNKINHISPQSNDFTKVLGDIDISINRLYYIGTLPESRPPTVAIVGTRRPTPYGREVTYQLANRLASRGVVIVSGMALGVDGIAHQGALDAGGITLAVQANGLDKLYPSSHRQLGEKIIAGGGAIISEYPAGTPPLPYRFLERNRIVSGLADTVIITEANSRSGTLNTAAHALTQGRDVYAVPGNITSPLSAGCNKLIAQGAQAIYDIDAFVEQIAPRQTTGQQSLPLGSNELENTIIQALASGIRDGDAILHQAKVSASDFNTALTMLEINGIIRPLGANQWVLR